MKIEGLILAVFCATCIAVLPPSPVHRKQLLGSKECTWGPSYWCQNLTTAGDCRAVKHCIQTVWVHKQLPPDSSEICQTCLDMVKQARDELLSNETQELIKEVFEGTCALIHIKPVVKECDKIADNYIPELVETLASEMNPQIVCSVAGLCNNDKIDHYTKREQTLGTCTGCLSVVDLMERKFEKMSRDDFLNGLLMACGKAGSLSDACSNIVITYFNEIYQHLQNNLNPRDVCIMAGECSAWFHTHPNIEISTIPDKVYDELSSDDDDLPCELCQQLVNHLRDLLVANTTEDEFKLVLQGLCKQTKSFTKECLSLVDTYYQPIYTFLVSELNSSEVCILGGLCPNAKSEQRLIAPLLPVQTVDLVEQLSTSKPVARVNLKPEDLTVKIFKSKQQQPLLPIDLLVPPHTQVVYNSQLCVFCEYFLHYVQQVITNPKSEEEIKEVIDKACSKLPASVNSTCVEFVNMYEPALIAILAQEIDPSQVCPLIKACATDDSRQDIEVFMQQQGEDSKCPLCLFAVSKLEEMIKGQKTEQNIEDALSKLCSHLSQNLKEECDDFVNTYTKELVEMLIADLSPQEVCVYLKLCSDKTPPNSKPLFGGDTETNDIMDNTIDGKLINGSPVKENTQCVLCEFIMRELQDELKDNKTEAEIKQAVRNVCNMLPATIKTECNQFVDQYADAVIALIIATTEPEEICRVIHLCPDQPKINAMKVEIGQCALCEAVVYAMEHILSNPTIDHSVEHVIEKSCRALPAQSQAKCIIMVEKYGKDIYDLVLHLANKGLVCHELGLCASEVARPFVPIEV